MFAHGIRPDPDLTGTPQRVTPYSALMRHLTTTAALVTGAALLLAGCTSDSGSDSTDVATPSSPAEPEAAGTPSENGWYCALIDDELVTTATGGDLEDAREAMVSNDDTAWVCEVNQVSGATYETVLRLSVYPGNQEQTDALRAELSGAQGMERGPEYLGEAYFVPGKGVALMSCNLPEREGEAGGPGPYAFVIEGLSEPAAELTEELRSPLRRLVTQIDGSVGCYPGDAYEAAPPEEG